jgi:hypothetical protein
MTNELKNAHVSQPMPHHSYQIQSWLFHDADQSNPATLESEEII